MEVYTHKLKLTKTYVGTSSPAGPNNGLFFYLNYCGVDVAKFEYTPEVAQTGSKMVCTKATINGHGYARSSLTTRNRINNAFTYAQIQARVYLSKDKLILNRNNWQIFGYKYAPGLMVWDGGEYSFDPSQPLPDDVPHDKTFRVGYYKGQSTKDEYAHIFVGATNKMNALIAARMRLPIEYRIRGAYGERE
jgi:hypothetical protein